MWKAKQRRVITETRLSVYSCYRQRQRVLKLHLKVLSRTIDSYATMSSGIQNEGALMHKDDKLIFVLKLSAQHN